MTTENRAGVSEKASIPLSIVARDLLIDANISYSASATAQGAFIARNCKESGLKPLKLAQALFRDNEAMEYLLTETDRLHREFDVFVPQMTLERVSGAVRQAFVSAHNMRKLGSSQLAKIVELYDPYVGHALKTNPLRRRELEYRQHAEEIIKEAKRTRRKNQFSVVFRWMQSATE